MGRIPLRKVAVIVLALLVVSAIPVLPVHAQQNPWFPESQAYDYVNNLINDFNVIVQVNQAQLANFTTYQANFQLWHNVGYNFRVQVMRLSTNFDGAVGFTFQLIGGNDPEVSVVNNQTIDGLFSFGPITTGGQNYEFTNCTPIFTTYGNACAYYALITPTHSIDYPIMWVTGTQCALNDTTGGNAQGAAQSLYNQDLAFSIPPGSKTGNRTAEQTTTLPQSSLAPCMLAAGNIPNVFNSASGPEGFKFTPTVILGGIVGGIVVASGVIVAYFGSLREFVKVVGNRKERGKVIQELRDLRRKKKTEEKNDEKGKPKK